jgi:hypothetical protein
MVGAQARQHAGYERRLIAAIAAYVFLLQALIVAFAPMPSSAELDLAASAYDICHHPGQPSHIPAGHGDPCALVGFFSDCCAMGHGGLAPSVATAFLDPPAIARPIARRPLEASFSRQRRALAARPRGPPIPA